MNPIEQLALGALCAGRAVRELLRRPIAAAALVPFAAQALAIGAIVRAAHPALSAVMAPLVRALAGDDTLRYPQLFHALPRLAALAQVVIAGTVGAVTAGAATGLFADAFRGLRPRVADAWRSAFALALPLCVASLPATLAGLAAPAALHALGSVRLSGLSRLAAPHALAIGAMLVQSACLYVPAEVVLGRRGPFGALAAIPGAFTRGFLAAVAIRTLAALVFVPFAWLEPWSAAEGGRRLPELSVIATMLRAGLQAAASVGIAGAATLAWQSVVRKRGSGT